MIIVHAIIVEGRVMRKSWIDTLKLFSIFFIFATHFISKFHSEYFRFWSEPPYSYALGGVTGKLCVAFLGVCLGYFAYNSKEKKADVYILRRYFFFFISGLFINTLRIVLLYIGLLNFTLEQTGLWERIWLILKESLLIGSKIYPTFWCMFPFFVASVISYFNGRLKNGIIGISIQIVFFWLMKQVWVSICLLGALVAILENNKTLQSLGQKKILKAVVLIAVFFLIKRKESEITYFIDGVCSCLLLLVVAFSPRTQQVLSIRFLSSQGQRVMAIYLLHAVVYVVLGRWIFGLIPSWPYIIVFIISFVFSWILTVLLSFPVMTLLNKCVSKFTLLTRRMV